MIAKLTGILDHQEENTAVIDVNGVGYLVSCAAKTLSQIGPVGASVTLVIETHMREDGIYLYGFLTQEEKHQFRLLTSVQGVGARVALAILNILPPPQLTLALAAEDKNAFTRADGVGPKLANRILSELKDKATIPLATENVSASPTASAPVQDAVSALVNLGYKRSDAFAVAMRISTKETDISEIVRQSLKELGSL